MCQFHSPFYFAVNHKPIPGSKWYKNKRMGKDRIGQFMKRIASEGALSGKKTNHSVRKTMITSLASSNHATLWPQKRTKFEPLQAGIITATTKNVPHINLL